LRAVVGGGVHQRQQFWLQKIFSGASFVAAMRIAGQSLDAIFFAFCVAERKIKK